MFQDALVESAGKLQTKSKYWMLATFALNLFVLAAAILLPLLHPEALPRTAFTATLIAPPPPPPAPKAAPTQVARSVRTAAPLHLMTAPSLIPHTVSRDPGPPPAEGVASTMADERQSASGVEGGILSALHTAPPVVVTAIPTKPKQPERLHVSSGVAAGALLNRTQPVYPAIAKAARISGSVVLRAVISRTGAIESLQVVSGPEMLRASVLDAVRQWRYRPYLLNGEPTEVDTSITVNFSFGG